MIDCVLVVGVDRRHLRQLSWTWPTWRRHKPALLANPMVVFHDREQVTNDEIRSVVDHPDLTTAEWPPPGVTYSGGDDKFSDAQRHRMLAGFVHVPAAVVKTPWWLKLDTDVVATGRDDWIDPAWFAGDERPVIISHPWGFTKPPDQVIRLDEWAEYNKGKVWHLDNSEPLRMKPEPGADRLSHPRIISWCAIFNTSFTRQAADIAQRTCGPYQLPVPSQDGYLFYLAKRLGYRIERHSMKKLGWQHWSTDGNVRKYSEEAMR